MNATATCLSQTMSLRAGTALPSSLFREIRSIRNQLIFGTRVFRLDDVFVVFEAFIRAVGCIAAELFRLTPLFSGSTNTEQFCDVRFFITNISAHFDYKRQIVSALGFPNSANWPQFGYLFEFDENGRVAIEIPAIVCLMTQWISNWCGDVFVKGGVFAVGGARSVHIEWRNRFPLQYLPLRWNPANDRGRMLDSLLVHCLNSDDHRFID